MVVLDLFEVRVAYFLDFMGIFDCLRLVSRVLGFYGYFRSV